MFDNRKALMLEKAKKLQKFGSNEHTNWLAHVFFGKMNSYL